MTTGENSLNSKKTVHATESLSFKKYQENIKETFTEDRMQTILRLGDKGRLEDTRIMKNRIFYIIHAVKLSNSVFGGFVLLHINHSLVIEC